MHDRFDHDDGLTDPVFFWDADDTATDRAYEAALDEKLGVTQ